MVHTDAQLNPPALVLPHVNPEAVAPEDRRILIVDDEPSIRDLFAACLNERYLCATAPNAETALAQLAAETYALVLTDMNMPGLSASSLLGSSARTVIARDTGSIREPSAVTLPANSRFGNPAMRALTVNPGFRAKI